MSGVSQTSARRALTLVAEISGILGFVLAIWLGWDDISAALPSSENVPPGKAPPAPEAMYGLYPGIVVVLIIGVPMIMVGKIMGALEQEHGYSPVGAFLTACVIFPICFLGGMFLFVALLVALGIIKS